MKKQIRLVISAFLALFIAIGAVAPTLALPEKSYDQTNEGELLYEADFRGNDGIYEPQKLYTAAVNTGEVFSVSDDGKAITLTALGDCYVGAPVKGLQLNSTSSYTIKYTVQRKASSSSQGFYIDTNGDADIGVDGFYGYTGNIAYMRYGSNKSGYYTFSTLGMYPKNEVAANDDIIQQYKVIVDVPNDMMAFYVLLDDTTHDNIPAESARERWGLVLTIKLSEYGVTFSSSELCLIFRSWIAETASAPNVVTFSNVRIYKGFTESIAIDRPGELLIDLGDMSQAQTGAYGVTYTPDVDQYHATRETNTVYSYDSEEDCSIKKIQTEETAESNTTTAYGGTTNLRLGFGQKYTIIYKVAHPGKGGTGLRYSFAEYRSSQGVYMDYEALCIARGTATGSGGAAPYKVYTSDMMPGGTVFADDGYAYVAIELDGNQVTVYVNGEKLHSYSSLAHDSSKASKGFSTEYLSLVIQDYVSTLTFGAEQCKYKDIRVYSGLVVSSTYIKITNGAKSEMKEFQNDSQYTLPVLSLAGNIFMGWKVNDGEIKNGGEVIEVNDVKTLDAVWEKPLEKAWVQFKDNGNNTQDMRIVGILDTLNYKEIGYKMVIKYTYEGSAQTITEDRIGLNYVYTSLSAKYGTDAVTPEGLGYGEDMYLTSFVIKNLPVNIGVITVELTPYTIGVDGEAPVYYDDSIVITLNNGILQ